MTILQIKIPEIGTYSKDKRKPLFKIYSSFSRLKENKRTYEILYNQIVDIKKSKNIPLPILAFRTRKKGSALWIIGGIHGEEPAGPNAISKNIRFLNRLSKRIPIVILPLCNPVGYVKDWRYPNRKNSSKKMETISVGDSEHLLIDLKNRKKPRKEKPSCNETEAITSFVIRTVKDYKPVLVLDFHEDKSSTGVYIYSQGRLGHKDPIAKKVVSILKKSGFKFYRKGKTSFNQKIIEGIVSDINDGSIDELLASKEIILNKKTKRGSYAKSVIVIETPIIGIPLSKRVKAHSKILRSSKKFFKMAQNIEEKKKN